MINLIFNIFDGVLASLYFQRIETSLVDGRELLDGENNVLSILEMCMYLIIPSKCKLKMNKNLIRNRKK